MATTSAATLLIKVITDTKGAAGDLESVSGKTGRLAAGLKKAAIPAAIAGAAIIKFGSDAVDAASRTQQAMGAVDSVFGKNAGTVKKWAANAASQLGLAKSEYGELASVIGAQLKNAGLPMDQVTAKTGDLIKLGADLAATYGGTTKEAVEALGAALRGEADPAERYGLALNQTRVNAELAAKGQDKLTGEALAQAKAQTLVAMATKQAGGAVGQFARESDTASGSAQIAAAEWENAQSALGTALLPTIAMVTTKLAGMAKWMGNNTKTVQILAGVILAMSAAVFVLIGALKVYEAVTKAVAIVSKATWLSNPIFLVIAAVVALGVAMVVLYRKSSTFRNFVNAMWAGIKTGVRATVQVFKAVWRAAIAAVKGYFQVWRAYVTLVFNVLKGIVKAVVAVFKGDWRGALAAVRGIIGSFRDFFRSVFNALPDPVQRVIEKIKSGLGGAFQWLKDKASGLGSILSKPFDTLNNAIGWVIDKVNDLISALSRIKVPHISLPKIPGLKSAPAPGPSALMGARGVSSYAAPSVRGGVGARASGGGAGSLTINVTGALDPEAVARQINRVLSGHNRRVGLVSA